MRDEDEQQLLRAVAAGDRAALKRLYERHAPGLTAFITQRLRRPEETADVIQETFLAVWRGAGGFKAGAAPKTWIYAIARNKTLDRLRRNGRAEPLDEAHDVPDAHAINAEAALEAAGDHARLRACVEGLSAAHRRAVELAFYHDFTYAEIAEIEAAPEGTIKTRIHHAKKLLLRCLGGRPTD